jgi:DeoR/GlpR family transcriptional regulator of sugar metabolism
MIRCPNCGAYLDIQKPTLTWRQQQIRRLVRDIVRDTGKPARTIELADQLAVSKRTVQYELALLESIHEIHRPNGAKSGWAIEETPVITLARELVS